MSHLTLGLICGIAFGAVSAAIMAPMEFPDKRTAITSAFINRFAIGLLIPLVSLPAPYWATGLIVALLLSIPAAIVTKAYAPILGLGAIGGVIIGFVTGKFAA